MSGEHSHSLGAPGACKGCPPQWQGEFAARIQCLRTHMTLQRHASYVAWLMWQLRLYVDPQRPCMTTDGLPFDRGK